MIRRRLEQVALALAEIRRILGLGGGEIADRRQVAIFDLDRLDRILRQILSFSAATIATTSPCNISSVCNGLVLGALR